MAQPKNGPLQEALQAALARMAPAPAPAPKAPAPKARLGAAPAPKARAPGSLWGREDGDPAFWLPGKGPPAPRKGLPGKGPPGKGPPGKGPPSGTSSSLSAIAPLSDPPQKRRRDRSPESPAAAPSKALCPDCGDKDLGEPPDRCSVSGRELCDTCLDEVLVRCLFEHPRWQRFRTAMLPRGATRDQPAEPFPGRRT